MQTLLKSDGKGKTPGMKPYITKYGHILVPIGAINCTNAVLSNKSFL